MVPRNENEDLHPAEDDFWEKFESGQPSFANKRVLEIGCGLGRRSIEIAKAGGVATGIDISEGCIAQAEAERRSLDPDIANRVVFKRCAIEQIEKDAFDIVISEDTFEHIVDVPQALASVKEKLVGGGRAYIGFGPLYHSPYGDHGWLQKSLPFGALPWSHLFLPQNITYKIVGNKIGSKITNTTDWPYLSLNQHTVSDYRQMFEKSGLKIACFSTTKHKKFFGKIFDQIAKLPYASKYFTDGIYCILEKEENSNSIYESVR